MADNLFDMLVFVRVVDAGSLSRAARDLKLSLAVIGRKLARLEERLGVRLVNRTTRRLALTEEGAAFHRRCARILAEIEDAETEVTRGLDRVVGLLRITSTFAFGRRRLAPLLLELQVQHPELEVELQVSDSVVNLLEGGYDMAIRFGATSRVRKNPRSRRHADLRLISIPPWRRGSCRRPALRSRYLYFVRHRREGRQRPAYTPINARVTSRSADGSAGDADYGKIGAGYATYRQPDTRIAARIHAALGPARTVLNVGAGAGSYEPIDRAVIAVEPSASMRAQRPSHLPPAVDATAQHLPFPERHFEASMATFTVHQWSDLRAGLAEMRRVTRGPVVILSDAMRLAPTLLEGLS